MKERGRREKDERRRGGSRNSYARLSQLLSGDASIISVGRNEHTNHQQTALRRWLKHPPEAEGKKKKREKKKASRLAEETRRRWQEGKTRRGQVAEVRAIGVAKGDVRKRRNSREKSGFPPPPPAGNAGDKGWAEPGGLGRLLSRENRLIVRSTRRSR